MSCHLSPDAETAVVVALQTDFAAWLGARELHAMLDSARDRLPDPRDGVGAERDAPVPS